MRTRMERIWRMTMVGVGVSVCCAWGLAACNAELWGFPRTAVEARSPDGRSVAAVRNHPTIDPPQQSLWLTRDGHSAQRLRELPGDVDWSDAIVWSADSSTVGFLIQQARLVTYDAATGRVRDERWLVPHAGSYPPQYIVRNLSLSPDGQSASFRYCDRRNDPSAPWAKVSPREAYDDVVTLCKDSVNVALQPPVTTTP